MFFLLRSYFCICTTGIGAGQRFIAGQQNKAEKIQEKKFQKQFHGAKIRRMGQWGNKLMAGCWILDTGCWIS